MRPAPLGLIALSALLLVSSHAFAEPHNGGAAVQLNQGGIRVPFILRWPGRVPAGKVYSKPVVSRDILPTFLAAAGCPSAGGWAIVIGREGPDTPSGRTG